MEPVASNTWGRIASVIGVVIAVVATFAGLFGSLFVSTGTKGGSPGVTTVGAPASTITKIQGELKSLESQIDSLTTPSANTRIAMKLNAIETRTDRLNQQLSSLQGAILDDPQKALELPLLRREVEGLRTTNAAQLQGVKDSIDQQNDLMKWVLGTFALGILGLLAPVVFTFVRSMRQEGETAAKTAAGG